MSQHICILTSAHPIDDVRVNSKIAASFLSLGFKVSWVGPEVSYFADVADRDDRIAYHLTAPNRNKLDRMTSVRRVARKAREVKKVDWYYSPDPDAAEAAVRLARSSGAKVIFDIHEIYHGAMLDHWLLGLRASVVRNYVRNRVARTTRRSDLVIGVSESVLRPYLGPRQARICVRNCAPRWFGEATQPRERATPLAFPENWQTIFMHGKASRSSGTKVVLEALAILDEEHAHVRVVMFPSTGPNALPFMPDLAPRIERLGIADSVWLHEAVTHRQMPGFLAQCDVGIIAYGRSLGEDSLPNRLFEYMASGIAVLAPSYAVEIRRIVETENIGLTVDFEDPADVAKGMRWFVTHPKQTREMGARARVAFLERHNWDGEFDRLIEAMARV